jgi:signal transduction histidine kinase/ActR/RegA family two-component response regulator
VDLHSSFDLPDDASAEEVRARLDSLIRVLERAPVPIAVAHDPACRFISANDALARLLGVPADVNISLTPPPGEDPNYRIERGGEPIPPDELPMQYAIAHRTHVTNDIEIVRADGRVVYVRNDVEPLYDAKGNVYGCVSVCVDETENRHAEQVLRDADRRKDEFLATLSHELRNPLAPLRNALELLRRAGNDPRVKDRALAIMGRQLHQLVRLTDDLLDVSRITSDRMELRRAHLDLRTVVSSAVETTQPLLDAAGHVLTVDLPVEPLWIDADYTRMAQAFANLLNNAAKYTERGGRITVSARREGDDVVASVTDTGIGIDSHLMPRIFDMFMQVDRSSDRAQSGLGIGLTLAKRLIELHHGRLEARSEGRGRGTTFEVRLPAVSAPSERRETAKTVGHPAAASCRVLVAEDIPDAAEMLRLMLESMGHEVRVAADGVQAVALAREFAPRVALLDIGMPRMDGYEAARQIRAALGDEVMLVALTGWGQEDDQQRALEAGFDRHLTKPADPELLEDLIAAGADGSFQSGDAGITSGYRSASTDPQ